jgi:hypothetical protein
VFLGLLRQVVFAVLDKSLLFTLLDKTWFGQNVVWTNRYFFHYWTKRGAAGFLLFLTWFGCCIEIAKQAEQCNC